MDSFFHKCPLKQFAVSKESTTFLITKQTQGAVGYGIRKGASFLLFLLTLFFPPLPFSHSDTPPSTSPPLSGLPTPPLSRRKRRQTEKKVIYEEQQFTSHTVSYDSLHTKPNLNG